MTYPVQRPGNGERGELGVARLYRAVRDAFGDVSAKGSVDAPFGRANGFAVLFGEIPRVEPYQARAEVGRQDLSIGAGQFTELGQPGPAAGIDFGDEQFQAMLDVHLVAPFRILRAAAEPIRILAKKEAEAGSEVFRKVVNISSIAGLYGNAGQASYSSAKASLVGLTRTMCKEWGRYKVNVNCVAFGLINARLTQPIEAQQKTIDVAGRDIKVGVQPQMLDAMAKMIPLGRGGTPEEAAGAVYLFCGPESNYISGQVIVCGGGLII